MEGLLKEILSEIQGIKADIQMLDARLERMEARQERTEQKVDHIYDAVVRLEGGQPKDIVAMLDHMNRKIDDKDAEIMALNRRVFRVESDIEKVGKQ